ncbi:fimbria/pilus outer membrane usher protein [Marinomonas polaris]|uniref:fimbria/pilus outer membrane usher protein n=1 Tax=Marinomonas polaris TaxID=293552 RepID=UPI003F9EB714
MRYLIFVFFLVFISLPAYSKINPTKRNIELSVEAEVNKNSIGRLTLTVTPADSLLLHWDEIEPIFERFLYSENLVAMSKNVQNQLISTKGLEIYGLAFVFDLSDFSLEISVPSNLIKPQFLSLKSNARPLDPLHESNFSGYMNVYSSYFYQDGFSSTGNNEQSAIRTEMVVNIKKWVLENEAEYDSEKNGNGPIFKRLGTRLVHDIPDSGLRVILGDKNTTGSYFQSSSSILGIALSHNYSLVSDDVVRPSASRSFTLDNPSSVEVILDDQVIQRLNLESGIYLLDDIPIKEGNNNIILRITDNVGKVSIINFDVTTGLNLFAEGDLKYELFFGVPSVVSEEKKYNYDDPLISGYLDYGITTAWTAGINAQTDEYVQQIGFKNIVATTIGQFAFENSWSISDELNGSAYRIVFNTFTDPSIEHRNFSVGYEHASQNYLSLGYRPDQNNDFHRREHIFQANYSYFNTPNFQTYLFVNASTTYGEEGVDKTIGASFSHDFYNGQWRYNFGGQWEENNGKEGWRAKLSLLYKFSNTQSARLSQQSGGKKTRLEFTQDSNRRYVDSFNYRVGAEKNDQDEAEFDLYAQYNANRFLASIDHSSSYEELSSQSADHQTRLSFSSSIAFADGDWAVGKPIYDSFALVKAHSSLESKKITLGKYNNQYRASNEDFPTILLNDINSYSRSTVSVDVDDLAPGYDIGSGVISFYPSYRSGHQVVIGTEANISVIATLLDEQNVPLVLQVGTAVCTTDSKKTEIDFFTNKKGKFALTGLMPCQYEITLNNDRQSKFLIDVKENEQLQRKGVIHVH